MSTSTSPTPIPRRRLAITLVGALFFLFGFVTWLNGPLIGFVQLAFEQSEVGAFLVPMAFYLSYFFLSWPAGSLLQRIGMKSGMAAGLLVMAAGALAFGEFTTQRWYPGALVGLFVIGAGLSLLQTAVNPYVSVLGPIESAAPRIALMGICNKVAGILAPLVLGALVLHDGDALAERVAAAHDAAEKAHMLDAFAAAVRMPYRAMAGVLVLLAAGVKLSPLPELRGHELAAPADVRPDGDASQAATPATSSDSLWRHPHTLLGALCIFFYVGAEVMAADAIGVYGGSFGLPIAHTRFFTSFTLAAMLLGYGVGLLSIPRWISQRRFLAGSAVLGGVLTLCAWASHGYVSVGFVAALGLANAMMWPAIFPMAIRGLGPLTERGSALLVMGIVGGAIVPQLFAVLKQHHDFQAMFAAVMLPCYAYVWFYAWRGHRVGVRESGET